MSGDNVFNENITLDGLDWSEFSTIINPGSEKNVLVELTIPSNWTSFGIKSGDLTFWAAAD